MQKTVGYGHLLYNIALLNLKNGENKIAGNYFRQAYNAYTQAGYIGESRDRALENAERYE
ncbi:MAG: hypothetical protein GF364_14680 [Candidatus Lokiarchaeota archaeon]|nr:hypothetical protein [Candidatus Lokiarchaeota archaeon]